MSDETGWEGGYPQLVARIGIVERPVPSPGPAKENLCAGAPRGVYSIGLLAAKTEIPAKACRVRTR